MHRLTPALGRHPGALLLDVTYVLVAVVVHSAAAIALAAGLLAMSAARRGLGYRLALARVPRRRGIATIG